MQSGPPLALFKFGKQCHIDSLVHGRLYMNPLSYFSKLEDDELRSDSHEGQELWLQSDSSPVYITINGVPTLIPGIRGGIALTSKRNLSANVFCMYVLRSSRAKEEQVIDPRNLRFGDTFALFRVLGVAIALPAG